MVERIFIRNPTFTGWNLEYHDVQSLHSNPCRSGITSEVFSDFDDFSQDSEVIQFCQSRLHVW